MPARTGVREGEERVVELLLVALGLHDKPAVGKRAMAVKLCCTAMAVMTALADRGRGRRWGAVRASKRESASE